MWGRQVRDGSGVSTPRSRPWNRDAAAHGAGADDGDAVDLARLGAVGHTRDLRGLAFGEEGVTLRLGLVGRDELEETLALLLQTFVERQLDGGTHGIGRGERRFQPPRLLGQRGYRIGEDRNILLGRGELAVVVAQLAQRALLGDQLAGKGFTTGSRSLDDLLDQAVLQCLDRKSVV